MIRVRKLVLAIAAATSLTSGVAHALGLGEISLQSSLNQPLNADIALLEVRDLDTAEIITRLASAEDFSKAGVERDYFLTGLKFTPVILPNGKSVIHVTSAKPVREPYLNFLVEVVWPSGRVLREYTLLLDPPMYSPETAVAAAPRMPVAAPAPAPVYRAPMKPVDGPFKVGSLPGTPSSARPATAVPRPTAAPAATRDGQYRTTRNDTLWEIAQSVRGTGTLNQTMLAIQDLNPDAFVGGNINRLKSGQVLRLPDAAQINARSAAEASQAVAEQKLAWQEGRALAPLAARQLDATKRDVAGEAPATVENKDSLRLVAADAGKAAATSEKGIGDEGKALADKLAVTQESLDTSRRQGDELKGKVADLEGQLDKLQKLIELKNSQLAKLQADLAAQEKLAGTTAQSQAAAPVAEPQAPNPPVQPETVAATPSIPPAQTPAPAAAPAESVVVAETQGTAPQPEASPVTVATAPVEVKPAEPAKPVEAVEPVQIVAETETETVVEEPAPTSLVDAILENPLLLGAGGAGLLVILLGLMALSRRKAASEAAVPELSSYAQADDSSFADDMDLPEESFAGLDDLPADQTVQETRAQTADVLGEADIYIAYGKFNQAAELLQGAINDEPQRADLRLKQMEVLAELGDRDGFLRQAEELQEIGGFGAQVEQIKARYPAMAAAAFVAGVGSVAASQASEEQASEDLLAEAPQALSGQDPDDAFDLSLDELKTAMDDELHAASPSAASGSNEFSLDIDFDEPAVKPTDELDFDLALDDIATSPASFEPRVAEVAADDFSGFDLDLESDFSASGDAAADLQLGGSDDFSFDADLMAEDLPVAGNDLLEGGQVTQFDLPADENLQHLEPIADVEFEALGASGDGFTVESFSDQASSADLPADDEDFDFLSGTDEAATKLDLARAYIDMGDGEGARDILDEVIAEGTESQQQEARELMGKLV